MGPCLLLGENSVIPQVLPSGTIPSLHSVGDIQRVPMAGWAGWATVPCGGSRRDPAVWVSNMLRPHPQAGHPCGDTGSPQIASRVPSSVSVGTPAPGRQCQGACGQAARPAPLCCSVGRETPVPSRCRTRVGGHLCQGSGSPSRLLALKCWLGLLTAPTAQIGQNRCADRPRYELAPGPLLF